MLRRPARIALAAALGAAAPAAPLRAQPVVLDAPPAGGTLITFNELASETLVTTQYAALGLTVSGGACAFPDELRDAEFGGDPRQLKNFIDTGPESFGRSCRPGEPIYQPLTFSFVTPITYFGVNLSGIPNQSPVFTTEQGSVTFAPGQIGVPAPFRGIADARPFSTVTISTNRATSLIILDDLRFGAGPASVVPEPSTVALVGAGLAAVGAAARRRRRGAAR